MVYSRSGNKPETELGSSSVRIPHGSSKVPRHAIPNQDQRQRAGHRLRFLHRSSGVTQQSLQQLHQAREPIFVSHGCLLIPVFLAAWWYYTKRAFRRVTGFIRNKAEPEVDATENFHEKFFRFEDADIQWEDILDDTKDETRTDRFVKWINRRNVRRQQAKRDVRSTTHRVLNSSKPEGDSSRYGRRTVTSLDSYDGFTFLDPLTNQPSMQWECLSDGGDMELCAMSGSVLEGEDSIVTLGSLRRMLSDEELMQARSMPTLAETLSHATGSEDNMESPYDEAQSRVVT